MLDWGRSVAVRTAVPPLRQVADATDGFASGWGGEPNGDAEGFDEDDADVGSAGPDDSGTDDGDADDGGADDAGAEDTGAEVTGVAELCGTFGNAGCVDLAPSRATVAATATATTTRLASSGAIRCAPRFLIRGETDFRMRSRRRSGDRGCIATLCSRR
jgi:hypothetical protein